MQMAISFALICNTGCRPPERPLAGVQLSADSAENGYLSAILSGRNRDSIVNCAVSDYQENKYYVFISATPPDERFDRFLDAYAKQKYQLMLVNCGCKAQAGACWYNDKMAALLSKSKPVSFAAIYLEAKNLYNKTLPVCQHEK
jgi:hypothetical protein